MARTLLGAWMDPFRGVRLLQSMHLHCVGMRGRIFVGQMGGGSVLLTCADCYLQIESSKETSAALRLHVTNCTLSAKPLRRPMVSLFDLFIEFANLSRSDLHLHFKHWQHCRSCEGCGFTPL